MGYVAVSRVREEAMIFTNSTEQLKAALDRSIDKEMAVEAMRLSNQRDSISREERERPLTPIDQQNTIEPALAPDMSNSDGNNHDAERGDGEEIEL